MKTEELVNLCPDIQFMPCNTDKMPLHTGWRVKERKDYSYASKDFIAMLCGEVSGGLEAVDLDLKYDLTGTLGERFKKAVKAACPGLLEKLVVQKTTSGGFHWIYRCSEIEGNKKLARRPATEEEKGKGEKVKVLLETRGEGGYIICWPSDGYELVYGSFDKIQTITPEERDILFFAAREFNELIEEYKPPVRQEKKQIKGLSPFEDYNDRGDVVSLLEAHGWKVVGHKGAKTLLKRPGQTKARHSGNFDEERNTFSVFTTSTEFQEETAYQRYAVFAFLECNKDFREAYRKLYDMGYGDRKEERRDNEVKSRIDSTVDDYSFLATEEDYTEYLAQWRSGTFKMGATTGFPQLDKYFRFKEGNLVVINGHDNAGKSVVIWYLAMLSCLLHGWKWIIFSSENSVGSVYRKLIEFYWCKEIKEMTDTEFKEALVFVKKNFAVIRSDEEMYNYKDLIEMGKKLLSREKYKGFLIDPYNSLKIDMPKNTALSTHDYHTQVLSEIKLFGRRNNLSIYINCHAVTNALRAKDAEGHPAAPLRADTEGGGKFAAKADDFLTIHRKPQHKEDFDISEIHIRKIKETETGGRQTPFEEPFKMRKIGGVIGFKFEGATSNTNPILDIVEKRGKKKVPAKEAPGNKFLPNTEVREFLDAFDSKSKYPEDLNSKGPDDAPF